MLKKFLGWASIAIVTIGLSYIFIGLANVDINVSVREYSSNLLEVSYVVENNSIADLVIPRNSEKNLTLNYITYSANYQVVEESDKFDVVSRDLKLLPKGQKMAAKFYINKNEKAKYLELYIKQQPQTATSLKEKVIASIRNKRLKSDKIVLQ